MGEMNPFGEQFAKRDVLATGSLPSDLAIMQKTQFLVMNDMMKGLQEISECPLTETASLVMKDIAVNTLNNVIETLDEKAKTSTEPKHLTNQDLPFEILLARQIERWKNESNSFSDDDDFKCGFMFLLGNLDAFLQNYRVKNLYKNLFQKGVKENV
jgi:hypothetical protein